MLIEHSQKSFQFFTKLNGARAFLDYRSLPNNAIEIFNTEVPVEYRRRGIAKQLCKKAFEYAAENNLKVFTSCSFAERYAKDWASLEHKKLAIWPKSPYK